MSGQEKHLEDLVEGDVVVDPEGDVWIFTPSGWQCFQLLPGADIGVVEGFDYLGNLERGQ